METFDRPGKAAVLRLHKRDAAWVAHEARQLSMEVSCIPFRSHQDVSRLSQL